MTKFHPQIIDKYQQMERERDALDLADLEDLMLPAHVIARLASYEYSAGFTADNYKTDDLEMFSALDMRAYCGKPDNNMRHKAKQATLPASYRARQPRRQPTMVAKYKNLTLEQCAAYLADSGKCPYCGAANVEGDEVRHSGDKQYQNSSCRACQRQWVDVYTLSAVDNAEQTCAQCQAIINVGDDVEVGSYGLVHYRCPHVSAEDDC